MKKHEAGDLPSAKKNNKVFTERICYTYFIVK